MSVPPLGPDLEDNVFIMDCGIQPPPQSTIGPTDTVTFNPVILNNNTVAVSVELEFRVNGESIDQWSITVDPFVTNSAPESFVPANFGVSHGDSIGLAVGVVSVTEA